MGTIVDTFKPCCNMYRVLCMVLCLALVVQCSKPTHQKRQKQKKFLQNQRRDYGADGTYSYYSSYSSYYSYGADAFYCTNGDVTSQDYVCDGDNDCDDCSDERGADCDRPCVEGLWTPDAYSSYYDYSYGADAFECENGEVTSQDYVCDGDNDCGDCSDETCTEYECVEGLWRPDWFACTNGDSVDSDYICDGDNDCDDCSDERGANCDRPCIEGFWNPPPFAGSTGGPPPFAGSAGGPPPFAGSAGGSPPFAGSAGGSSGSEASFESPGAPPASEGSE